MTSENRYRQKPRIRKPKMYLMNDRICSMCGSSKTNDKIVNHIQWHRDNDEQGKWKGGWKCNKCYQKEYHKRREKEATLMREKFIEERNARLEKFEKE
jgi:hypothetical protein